MDFVRDHLGWAERIIRRQCGPKGVEFAAVALAEAVASHDGRSPLKAWASRKIVWVATREINQLYRSDVVAITDDMLHAGLSELSTDGPEASQELTGDLLVQGLRRIDGRGGKDRWESLGVALGGYKEAQARQLASQRGIEFTSVGEMADAAMLYGATLQFSRKGYGSPSITLRRRINVAQTLPWIIVVIEKNHDTFARFAMVAGERTVAHAVKYRMNPTCLLKSAYERWFPDGVCRTPADVITETTACAWLVDACHRFKPDTPLILRSPRMSDEAAEQIADDLMSFGLDSEIIPASAGCVALQMKGEQRADAEDWLSAKVPRFVWKR